VTAFQPRSVTIDPQKALLSVILASSVLMVVVGCSTGPTLKDAAGRSSGRFSAKALVRDLRTGKSQVVSLDLRVASAEQLRLDVTSTLGLHVFSLVLKQNQVEYIAVLQKKHFSGTATDRAFAPVLPVRVSPLVLADIFFENVVSPSFSRDGWSCAPSPATCANKKSGLHLAWEVTKDGHRLIKIDQLGIASVQISVKAFETDSSLTEDDLKLKVPASFQRL
jgi:hypothetical protein